MSTERNEISSQYEDSQIEEMTKRGKEQDRRQLAIYSHPLTFAAAIVVDGCKMRYHFPIHRQWINADKEYEWARVCLFCLLQNCLLLFSFWWQDSCHSCSFTDSDDSRRRRWWDHYHTRSFNNNYYPFGAALFKGAGHSSSSAAAGRCDAIKHWILGDERLVQGSTIFTWPVHVVFDSRSRRR